MASTLLTELTLPTLGGGADSLLLRDGKIARVGWYNDLKGEVTDSSAIKGLGGATCLPGLGDAHVHFSATGFLQTAINCTDIASLPELLERVSKEAERKAAGELILGLRLQHLNFPEARLPTWQELEAAAPHNPVYIRHITGHMSVANGRALSLLDFSAGQPGVKRNSEGHPTGALIAQATQLATQKMYAVNAHDVGYENAFMAAAKRAISSGCTVLHALDDLEAVRALMNVEAHLPIRALPYTQTFDIAAVKELGLPRIGGCHGCALDGDFDMHTAALLEPYHGTVDDYGVLYHNDLSLQGFVLEAHLQGLQVAFHAVGDRAVEQALCAFERAAHEHPREDARHRIEHAQLMGEKQMQRAREIGAVLSVQPAFNHIWEHHTYDEYVGERYLEVDPLRSLSNAGLILAGGSDSTVAELSPLLGVHSAVNHSRHEERLSVAEALRMFSYGVAYSTFHEGERGTIAEGMDADLTILSANPFEVAPKTIKDIPIAMTVVRGEIVWSL